MSVRRIARDDEAGLCILTLTRPDKLNALDTQTFEELDALCAALEDATDTIGCVIFCGAGRAFSAGADLRAIGTSPIDPRFKPGVVDRLARLPQPVIVAVHGVCFTGALELALAADFIIADPGARFADTHGKWGLVSAWGMSQRLPRRIGVSRAKLMMMTGEELSAAAALSIGLADLMSADGAVMLEARTLARTILRNSWHTNFAVKRFARETDGNTLSAGLAHEFAHNPGFSLDHEQRIQKFSGK